jgi:hypothetical protein
MAVTPKTVHVRVFDMDAVRLKKEARARTKRDLRRSTVASVMHELIENHLERQVSDGKKSQ